MEAKQKILCDCGISVLKGNFSRHLQSQKHSGKVVVKTFNPKDKIKCECGGFIKRSNWARHVKSGKHINNITQINRNP
jgi:hypothetical protein